MGKRPSWRKGIATPIKDNPGGEWQGKATLYKVEPPMEYEDYDDKLEKYMTRTTSYVIVSAVDAYLTGPETYIFPATNAGKVKDWGEMEGSFRGALDHEMALDNAGYGVAAPKGGVH